MTKLEEGQSDWITDFMTLTEGVNTPELFRLWSGISCVAGALERRVWAKVGVYHTFPNLYVLLVAAPAVGKFVINTVRELWYSAKHPLTSGPAFCTAPDSITKAALIDRLAKCKQTFLPPNGSPLTYHSLLIAAEEFGVLMPGWDNEFIATLNSIYNNPTVPYAEERRHGPAREVSIENPCLNILGGAQPVWIGMTLPEEAWGMGLMTRIIMVYQSEGVYHPVFYEPETPEGLKASLAKRLGKLATLYGQFGWAADAAAYMQEMDEKGYPPTPTHSKLSHYVRRRRLHIIKLALVSACSRQSKMVIELVDVKRAIRWILQAEALMPDIFRDMIGRSDSQVIEELHYFITSLWAKSKGQAVHESSLINFLSARVPSEKVLKLIEVAERSNVIERMAGTSTYKPRPKHDHGVE